MVRQDGAGMNRRTLLAILGAMAAAPASARDPARLAWISPGTMVSEVARLAAMRSGLADNGLIDGRDYVIEDYYADGDYQRFPELTRQALARNPAMLLVVTIASVRAAQQATKTIPIILMSTNDPVGTGLIDSLARPGGNTTGVATMADDVVSKLVDVMNQALPAARRIAVLMNPGNATNRPAWERARVACTSLGLEARAVEVNAPEALDGSLGPALALQPDAVIQLPDAMLTLIGPRIASLCIERRIPIVGTFRELPRVGGLLSYGPSLEALTRRSASYVKRVLAGAQPRDLPVEQPTQFELVVNLKTAKLLGVTIPASVLAGAADLIE
jgi:putative ABC transport system substrate-binding protein